MDRKPRPKDSKLILDKGWINVYFNYNKLKPERLFKGQLLACFEICYGVYNLITNPNVRKLVVIIQRPAIDHVVHLEETAATSSGVFHLMGLEEAITEQYISITPR